MSLSNNGISDQAPSTEQTPAKIRLRFLAMVYDGLIILFLTTLIVFIIEVVFIGDEVLPTDHILTQVLKPFWFIPGFFYLAYYWRKNGQTPSMKVWKIKLVNQQGQNASWPQALIRYITAILGFGLMWAFFNKNRASLQDVFSKTTLVSSEE